jgi:hypothetical protein
MRRSNNPDADINGIVGYIKAGRSFHTTCTVFQIGEKQYNAICDKFCLTRPRVRATKTKKALPLCSRPDCLKHAVNEGLCKTHAPRKSSGFCRVTDCYSEALDDGHCKAHQASDKLTRYDAVTHRAEHLTAMLSEHKQDCKKIAQIYWGERFTERRGLFYLNGHPINLIALFRRTHEALLAEGMPGLNAMK